MTADAFGAYLPQLVHDLSEVSDADLRAGFADFNRLNHPWVSLMQPSTLEGELSDLRRLDPTLLLSSHGVLAHGRTATLMEAMVEVCTMEPFVAPDQTAFEELRDEM